MKIENSQKKWANYMAILSIFGLSLIILPWIANFEPITTTLVALTLSISGLVNYFLYLDRAEQMDRLLNNRNVICRWKIDSLEWEKFVNTDISYLKSRINKTIYMVAIVLGITFVFLAFNTAESRFNIVYSIITIVFFVMIIGIVWFTDGSIIRKRQNQTSAEIIIADNCILLNEEFHIIKSVLNRLDSVEYYMADRILEFKYSYHGYRYRVFRNIRVPVPAAEDAQLQKVLKHFGSGGI
jgi:hypothetical protein